MKPKKLIPEVKIEKNKKNSVDLAKEYSCCKKTQRNKVKVGT
ncbi:hypothetical protein ACWOA0_01140 [Ignavigranum ruoffiae]|uniref:Uncharacterized protein n=1 Tax=Ignavigranum ruoffiae TaxID=89093 RepID=A0A1H8ZBH2_9LACT|nr:hypothetical protein [Ignavigranum ruoffiae]SEP61711.1 hypothetical protein SAMN04488558_101208 [Ignavigranum ruoffiae]